MRNPVSKGMAGKPGNGPVRNTEGGRQRQRPNRPRGARVGGEWRMWTGAGGSAVMGGGIEGPREGAFGEGCVS